MHYNVEPLRTTKEIEDFLFVASQTRYGQRNRLIILIGMNTGLRMSDILALNVGMVRDVDRTRITERKTGKYRWLYLKNIRQDIHDYCKGKEDQIPLFIGARGNRLTVNGVYRIFQRVGYKLNRTDIGTHTLRKTFGYHYYQQTHDIASLMVIFNHSSEAITKRYIGINRDIIEMKLENFKLGLK